MLSHGIRARVHEQRSLHKQRNVKIKNTLLLSATSQQAERRRNLKKPKQGVFIILISIRSFKRIFSSYFLWSLRQKLL